MTSHEILQSSTLDILFENRNKQYGAYTPRKFYANRMGVALAISLSSVLLIALLIPSDTSSADAPLADKGLVVLTQIELPKLKVDEPEPVAAKPVENTPRKTVDYQNYAIVPDDKVTVITPTINDLQHAAIGNTTIDGLPDEGQHTPPIIQGNGDAAIAQDPAPVTAPFDPVEKQPEYPGGVEAWRNFLSRYLQAPDELNAGERRTVHVRFMVSATGEVTDFEILQSAGTAFDREVLRVMKKMPKWSPAIQNGQAIAVSFVQPVTFQGIEE